MTTTNTPESVAVFVFLLTANENQVSNTQLSEPSC